MRLLVVLSSGSQMIPRIVEAASGDDAAARAQAMNPGCKVALVTPATVWDVPPGSANLLEIALAEEARAPVKKAS